MKKTEELFCHWNLMPVHHRAEARESGFIRR